MAVVLLYSAESAARAIREVHVTKIKETSEWAYYVAEVGFNRARARLIKKASDPQMLALDGRSDAVTDDLGATIGQYSLKVTRTAPQTFQVVSTGTVGTGSYAAKRVVMGTIQLKGTKYGDNWVTTTYNP